MRFLKSFNGSVDVSISSIRISPSMQAKRKMAPINELFPAPVRPTIPIFKIPLEYFWHIEIYRKLTKTKSNLLTNFFPWLDDK